MITSVRGKSDEKSCTRESVLNARSLNIQAVFSRIMRPLAVFVLLISGVGVGNAQTDEKQWRTYRSDSSGVSFLLPKLPVSTAASEPCTASDSKVYGAFHNGRVYVVKVLDANRTAAYCSDFNGRGFERLVRQMRTEIGSNSKSTRRVYRNRRRGRVAIRRIEVQISAADRTVRLINDRNRRRIIVLEVYGRELSTEEPTRFMKSLKLKGVSGALRIGRGAETTIGDDSPDLEVSGPDSNLRIVMKPKAPWTDEARSASIQGTVMLKAEFMANGEVGSISLIKGLPLGLNESAIGALRKIIFVPAVRSGRRVSMRKIVEYTFSIY